MTGEHHWGHFVCLFDKYINDDTHTQQDEEECEYEEEEEEEEEEGGDERKR